MENKKLLNIVEKISSIDNRRFPTLLSQLDEIVTQELDEKESNFEEFSNYMTKRLLNGATITEPLEQTR